MTRDEGNTSELQYKATDECSHTNDKKGQTRVLHTTRTAHTPLHSISSPLKVMMLTTKKCGFECKYEYAHILCAPRTYRVLHRVHVSPYAVQLSSAPRAVT